MPITAGFPSWLQATYFMYAKAKRRNCVLVLLRAKKIGTAVSRNRAKRVITAAFDTCAPHIPTGYDCVVVARTRILDTKSNKVAAILEKQLKQENLWVD